MSVTIECPQCHKRYTVDDSASGKTAVCQACGTRMQIPDLAPAAPPPEPEPEVQAEPEQAGELPRQMRANRAVAGRTCPICQKPVELGQAVRNCELCGQTHHDECWQKHNGCGTADCANAPLPDIGFAPGEAQPPAARPPLGTKPCPHCGEYIPQAAIKCRHCLEYLAGHGPAGLGRAPGAPPTASGLAIGSLVCGILSVVGICCYVGVALGPVAIVLGVLARKEIQRGAGRVGGDGMALAGIILGVIGTAFTAIFVLLIIIGSLASP